MEEPAKAEESQAEQISRFKAAAIHTAAIGPPAEGPDPNVMEPNKEDSMPTEFEGNPGQGQHSRLPGRVESETDGTNPNDPKEVIELGRLEAQAFFEVEVLELLAGPSGHQYPLKVLYDKRFTREAAIRLCLADSAGKDVRIGEIPVDLGTALALLLRTYAANVAIRIVQPPILRLEWEHQPGQRRAKSQQM